MDFKDLKALICEEFGYDSDDIRPETLLMEIVSDEYEVQELLAGIGEAIGALKLPMEKPFWMFILISFVAAVVGGIGAVACGIGAFFTMPLAYCIIVAAYNDMAGGEAAAQ